MPEIAILLPSLRRSAVSRRIIEFSATNPDVDYEIVIVSPFQVQGRNVLHVPEEERRGVIRAVNAAYANTSAEYIAVWSDDASPDFQCLGKMLDFLKTKNGPVIGSFRKRNANGKELEQWSVYGRLYGSW